MFKKVLLIFTIFLTFANIAFADESMPQIESKILLRTQKTWDGTSYAPLKINAPEITVVKITIPPNAVLPVHKHPMLNVAYLASGELTVYKKNGEQCLLKAGDALAEVVNTYHYGKNTGKEPVEIIVFYVGKKDMPLSVYEK